MKVWLTLGKQQKGDKKFNIVWYIHYWSYIDEYQPTFNVVLIYCHCAFLLITVFGARNLDIISKKIKCYK